LPSVTLQVNHFLNRLVTEQDQSKQEGTSSL
jgi:hypothetical protein